MSEWAIRVKDLGKRYRIGGTKAKYNYRMLRDSLMDLTRAPFRWLQRNGHGADPATVLWALRDVSFDVANGEVLGIIGRNGAGKSTLLKVLARITEPTVGYAETLGRVGSLLEVGTGFHPELTGRENVFLNGAILGMRRAEINRKFDEIVEFAGIEKFIETPVKHYSSGMYVRLAFAVAAHLEPDILVVDEVLAVGDLEFQRKCLGKMQDVSQTGRTVLFVSHNMPAITKLCTRAILLNDGTVVADGPAPDVVSEYVTATLGASASMEWTDLERSPGTDEFRLASVNVTDAKGTPLSVASVDQPIDVTIRYAVRVPNLKFRCEAQLNTNGVCAFATVEPVELVREKPGLYASTFHIPANLLTEGEYTISIMAYASKGRRMFFARANDAVVFQVYDPVTGASARGDYAEKMKGVVRPLLKWEMDYLSSELPA